MNPFQISSFRLEGTVGRQQAASSRKPQAGFTLMEVLVAITILAVVVTTILASFNSVFSTTEALDESADIYEMAISMAWELHNLDSPAGPTSAWGRAPGKELLKSYITFRPEMTEIWC
jgi:prepilin-type N-terminal cleavage/methylation domain-containing protein